MSEKDIRGRVRIGVIGGARPEARFEKIAREVGRRVAEAGAVLVCGGLAGVMKAAAQGAKEAGGLTIGILPGAQPSDANAYIDVPIATGLGYTRNSLVAMNADVLIAVDGEYGTLSEIAYGRIFGKPVIGLESWDVKGVERAESPEAAVRMALTLVSGAQGGRTRGRD
jgi:uncharacterized protein (TIGR00725 family)